MTLRFATPKSMKVILVLGLLFALAACEGQQPQATEAPTPVPPTIPGLDLVYVPAGSFFMGSDPNLDPMARQDEFPLHNVRLDGFFIFKNEVTNDMYAQCVAVGKCSDPHQIPPEPPAQDSPSMHYGEDAYKGKPVVGVDWNQAVAFCTWANSRLPTAAEWEKAARGEFAKIYPWGADQPTFDLAKMEGSPPPEPDMIGQHPMGESPYMADDMAGNVWEWTADFFGPYGANPNPVAGLNNVNPLGPEQGDMKEVRGGGFMSGPVDLRAAARMGRDPHMAFNDVGFRCVPIGMQSAAAPPFCQPSYKRFCNDPNNPGDCNPNPPPQGEGQPSNMDLLGIQCPQNGMMTFTINGGGPSADGYDVTINGAPYNCTDSQEFPGRWNCEGTAQSQGTLVSVTVCPKPSSNLGGAQLSAVVPVQPVQVQRPALVSFQPAQAPRSGLVAFAPSQLRGPQLQAATNGYCPEGYTYNPDTQQCEKDPNTNDCPEGWTYNPETYQCEPNEGGCPEGTTYNPDKQGCTPNDDGNCPPPYFYDQETQTCQPPSNDDGGGKCPQGYFFDRNILCCSPIPGDNNGCDQGSYFAADTGNCQPVDQNGCPEGEYYDPYEGACVPNNGDTTNGCEQGQVMNSDGNCVPAQPVSLAPETGHLAAFQPNGQCPPNSYYDYYLEQCVSNGGDNPCPVGQYYDTEMQTCRPNGGPGSPCGIGYAYDQRLNCCVPTPGRDGSGCPGDQQGSNNLDSFPPPSDTNYDYGQGYCDPGNNGECPEGYYFNSDSKTCEPVPQTPPNSDNQCPEGYTLDPATNQCIGSTDGTSYKPSGVAALVAFQDSTDSQCPEGTYFDYYLGYCVQAGCEGGCALGYYYNTDTQTCEPIGQQGCVTFYQTVPEDCSNYNPEPTPVCGEGETYRPSTGQCERNPQEPTKEPTPTPYQGG